MVFRVCLVGGCLVVHACFRLAKCSCCGVTGIWCAYCCLISLVCVSVWGCFMVVWWDLVLLYSFATVGLWLVALLWCIACLVSFEVVACGFCLFWLVVLLVICCWLWLLWVFLLWFGAWCVLVVLRVGAIACIVVLRCWLLAEHCLCGFGCFMAFAWCFFFVGCLLALDVCFGLIVASALCGFGGFGVWWFAAGCVGLV